VIRAHEPLFVPSLRPPPSSADVCHANGWTRGTVLAGDLGHGETVIRITAVGEQVVLARRLSQRGRLISSNECPRTLTRGGWREVTA
jgi:hypothetical protein